MPDAGSWAGWRTSDHENVCWALVETVAGTWLGTGPSDDE